MPNNFQIGDRVRCVVSYDGNTAIVGQLGTAVGNDGYSVAVAFDNDIGGHDLGGECEHRHGWNVPARCLELANGLLLVEAQCIGDFFKKQEAMYAHSGR